MPVHPVAGDARCAVPGVVVAVDEQLADGLQPERAEVGGGGRPVEVVQRCSAGAEVGHLSGRHAVGVAVVPFREGPVPGDQLGDGDGGREVAPRGRRRRGRPGRAAPGDPLGDGEVVGGRDGGPRGLLAGRPGAEVDVLAAEADDAPAGFLVTLEGGEGRFLGAASARLLSVNQRMYAGTTFGSAPPYAGRVAASSARITTCFRERAMGFEPTTTWLGTKNSTTELRPRHPYYIPLPRRLSRVPLRFLDGRSPAVATAGLARGRRPSPPALITTSPFDEPPGGVP